MDEGGSCLISTSAPFRGPLGVIGVWTIISHLLHVCAAEKTEALA